MKQRNVFVDVGKTVKQGRERDDASDGYKGEEETSEEKGGREIDNRIVCGSSKDNLLYK